MTTETRSNKAGAAWNVDFRKSGTQFEFFVTVADTGSTLVRHCLQPGAITSALRMLEDLTRRLGTPREIRTDHGTEFHSRAFREGLHSLGIQHRILPPSPRTRKAM
jgi:transposase InsO family protein